MWQIALLAVNTLRTADSASQSEATVDWQWIIQHSLEYDSKKLFCFPQVSLVVSVIVQVLWWNANVNEQIFFELTYGLTYG